MVIDAHTIFEKKGANYFPSTRDREICRSKDIPKEVIHHEMSLWALKANSLIAGCENCSIENCPLKPDVLDWIKKNT